MTTYPGAKVYPSESIFPGQTLAYSFSGPTTDVYYPLVPPPAHLFGVDHLGVNVFRIDGVWQTALALTPAQEQAADRIYRGGYVYPITADQRDELVAAGFAEFITAKEAT